MAAYFPYFSVFPPKFLVGDFLDICFIFASVYECTACVSAHLVVVGPTESKKGIGYLNLAGVTEPRSAHRAAGAPNLSHLLQPLSVCAIFKDTKYHEYAVGR
jgi:hypothetical protein